MQTPRFIYFDLGNVLLTFDHKLACRQMAQVSGIQPEDVWRVVFESGMQWRYEAGEVSEAEFHDYFCQETGAAPLLAELLLAGSAIFELNYSIVPVVAQLMAAGHRLGILSNTCTAHWNYVIGGRYGLLNNIPVQALSYEIGCCKPDARIYESAARLAGVAPEEIFFTDDIAGHVESARRSGYDAVQYNNTPALVEQLRERGVRFNY